MRPDAGQPRGGSGLLTGPRAGALVAGGLGAVLALAACTGAPGPTAGGGATSAPQATRVAADARSALGTLGGLTVARNEPSDGYARSRFGDGWLDPDGNGCSAREDVLRRDLTAVVLRATSPCAVVHRGTLRDPYTGVTVAFVRGEATSGLVQIDHVVSLSNAWRTGARHWTDARREEFANDPLNLLATTEAVNLAKGNDDAAQWLPPLPSMRCRFAARQVAVKARYGLTVRQAERDALAAVLVACPSEPLPS